MIRKTLYLTLLLVMALVLVACGGDGDDDGGDDDSGVDLSQSFTSENVDLGISATVSYPEGWASTDDAPTILLANSQELLDALEADTVEEFAEGQIGIIILPAVGDFLTFLGLDADATPVDAANAVVNTLFSEEDEVDLSDPEETELNGNASAILSGTATVEGVTSSGTVVAVQVEGGYMAVVARYDGDFDDEIRAIAGSIEVGSGEDE